MLADQIAIRCGEYVFTEAGFAADIGAEKFFIIKCRVSGLKPDAVVLIVTIRALKAQSGHYKVIAGKPLLPEMLEKNVADVEAGAPNLIKHIENVKKHGLTPITAINVYNSDHPEEIEAVKRIAGAAGALGASAARHLAQGGVGAAELGEMVISAAETPSAFQHLYPLELSIKQKIETIAREIYGAGDVAYDPLADRQITSYEANGFGGLPICMAKTQLSISHDPKLLGAPNGFTLPIREVRAAIGAGFIYPL